MKKTISIIGGGAAAITLAAFLDKEKFSITIFEKNKTLGRKFLVAGKGGFNLTHSEKSELLIKRYTPSFFLKEALINFNNEDLRRWLNSIGIPTYVGSSKRVYPKPGIKPIEVLNAIQSVLIENDVNIKYNKSWTDWDTEHKLVFNSTELVESDYVVFALGGASWKITGSDGGWLSKFEKNGVKTNPFKASNCAYNIIWENNFITKHEGTPLKNIAISCLNKVQKGEVVITKFGLEGNAIYALSPEIRSQLNDKGKAMISIDLKPTLSHSVIVNKINNSNYKNRTDVLKKEIKLSSAQISLLKAYVSKEEYLNTETLAQKIKYLPLNILKSTILDEAISCVGGIALSETDSNFQLKSIKNNYCIGEMLDWDAPTGGYLLQACFSMGVAVAKHLNSKS